MDDDDETLEDSNATQRDKVAHLGFTALDAIDELGGEHIVLDAMLLVEIGEKDDDGNVGFYIHRFSTTERSSVQRGIVEHTRDDLARFASDDD